MTAVRKVLVGIKSLKLWIVVVVAASAVAVGYYGVTVWTDSATEADTAQTQLVPVTRSDLVNDVSVTGTLAYTTRETLTFGQQGTVSEVLVSEGDSVSSGDVLAVLDAETVANLEKAVAQARVDVRNAEEAVDEAKNPYSTAQIARAESDVANARLDLREAEDELSEVGVVSSDLLVQARIDILNAEADLETVADARAALMNPTLQEVVRAESAVTAARLALQDAREDLDELLNPDEDAIADDTAGYQADIDSAEDTLIGALFDLEAADDEAKEEIRTAMDDLDAAQAEYVSLYEKWLGLSVAPPYGRPPEEIFAAHGVDLVSIFEESDFRGAHVQEMWAILSQDGARDDAATSWDEVIVFSWLVLYPGQVVVDCGDNEMGPHVACVRDEFIDAFDLVQELTANLETIQAEQAEKIRKARVTVTKAEDTVELRRQALDDYLTEVTAEPDPLLLESKARAIEMAEADLLDAETDLADLTHASDLDINLADHEIDLAQANLANSEEALAALTEAPNSLDVLVKQTAVSLAAESLAEAEATLEEYHAVDQLEIELREADVIAARASLDTAISDLERAALRAPFDGVVVAVNIEVDQQVNVNTQAIEIADPSVVEVSGSVDEIDVLFLQVGAQAFVSLEALGTQTLPGTVSSIASLGTSQQGVVTYPVTIRLDPSASAQLPEGLSATAQVIIREQTDSVLIPLQALYGSVQAPMVRVASGDDIIERQVTLGISDDFWVVVEDGLDEGKRSAWRLSAAVQVSSAGSALHSARSEGSAVGHQEEQAGQEAEETGRLTFALQRSVCWREPCPRKRLAMRTIWPKSV